MSSSQYDEAEQGDATLDAEALDLFASSLKIPASERDGWLREQCSGKPDLQRRVWRLAQADRASERFLDASPVAGFQRERVGNQLGPYEITGELATGGMSTVYQGRRADGTFEQDVAIKLFRADLMSPGARRRFEAERRILASLEHPGIARIIDGSTTDDGVPYVVMELVDGKPLTKYCAAAGLGIEPRLRLILELCTALQTAHSRGVIHRDIKPGNVLVDSTGHVRLIDFGIAKRLAPDSDDMEFPETRVDLQMYTPDYASPEQVRGDPVSVVSDVYSLGVLMYELLTGTRPYKVEALTPAGIEVTVCDTVPADPSKSIAIRNHAPAEGLPDLRSLRRLLKGDLDRIVMTALKKEPEHRYRSVEALANDIQRYLSNEPVRARGASMAYRIRKFVRRHPGATAATALTIVTLASALVVVSFQSVESRRQADRAEAARQFLVDMIGRSDPYATAGTQTLADSLEQAIPTIDEQFAGQPSLEADMRYAIGFALSGQGKIAAAREQLEQALTLYEANGTELQKAQVLTALAVVAWDESDYAESERLFKAALDQLTDLDGDDQPRKCDSAY